MANADMTEHDEGEILEMVVKDYKFEFDEGEKLMYILRGMLVCRHEWFLILIGIFLSRCLGICY